MGYDDVRKKRIMNTQALDHLVALDEDALLWYLRERLKTDARLRVALGLDQSPDSIREEQLHRLPA